MRGVFFMLMRFDELLMKKGSHTDTARPGGIGWMDGWTGKNTLFPFSLLSLTCVGSAIDFSLGGRPIKLKAALHTYRTLLPFLPFFALIDAEVMRNREVLQSLIYIFITGTHYSCVNISPSLLPSALNEIEGRKEDSKSTLQN